MVLIFLRIRLCFWQCLILFFFLVGCSDRAHKTADISILWEDERATGINIPRNYFAGIPEDSIRNILQISLLRDGDQPAMLGDFLMQDDAIVFKPLIPFTRGLTYEVSLDGISIAKMEIPQSDPKESPALTGIFPTQDTLPHNVLKFYLQFSRPMREGSSLQHIAVLKNGRDTVPGVFLDLQPELWNSDHTLLTVWLDPGRIKRDLQPNQKMGEPLEMDEHYQLVIDDDWQDTQGNFLKQRYDKEFFITSRDSLSPNPEAWIIKTPEAGTRWALNNRT